MEKYFHSLENNARFRKQLIRLDAGSILETCETKEDLSYLLRMIEAFLEKDNFFSLDVNLLYKLLLLMNLIRVKKENQDFEEITDNITKIVEELLLENNFYKAQAEFMLSYFQKYNYPYFIEEVTNGQVLKNLTEHYEEILTIKELGIPTDYYGKSSFLEVLNVAVECYHVHEYSYEMGDYLLAIMDFFTKDLRNWETEPDYKRYLKSTKKILRREVK